MNDSERYAFAMRKDGAVAMRAVALFYLRGEEIVPGEVFHARDVDHARALAGVAVPIPREDAGYLLFDAH